MSGAADPRAVQAGQAAYSKPMLAIYDALVFGFNCPFLWRCSGRHFLDLYNQCVSANHLDVGVGTGRNLDLCRFPVPQPRLALLDLNPNSLEVTAKRVARYRPEVYRANVLEPIRIDGPGFDSIGMSFLLHCLPGPMKSKAVALDHLKALLNPGGVLFGTTILHEGVKRNWAAKLAMRYFNAKKIFSNTEDSLDGLRSELTARFSDVSLRVVGCVALFSGRRAREG
jgi:ubiquinone/menaquinone biosynthesis C-methylase UbiE